MSALDDIDRGLASYAERRYFEAHEHFEAAWQVLENGPAKEAARGLVQIAAAELKRDEQNPRGVEKLLLKAGASLLRGADDGACFGLDVTGIAGLVTVARGTGEGPIALPRRVARAGVLYLHGFASGPTSAKARAFRAAMEAHGIPIRVPDLDESDFAHLTVTRALARARRCLFERTLIVGSSMGGYLASLLSGDRRVTALVLMAPAFDLAHRLELRYGEDALAEWRRAGTRLVDHHSTGRPEALDVGFFDDAHRHAPFPPIVKPAYLLHGRLDETVPYTLAAEAASRARAEVEVDIVEDDHALLASVDRAINAAVTLYAAHV